MALRFDENDPLDTFQFALMAKESKRQYPRRLKLFLDFGIDPNLQLREQCRIFYERAKTDVKWTTSYFMKFLEYQKDRNTWDSISSQDLTIC